MEFLDELSSGVPAVGAPSIQREFAVSYLETAGVLLLAPLLLGLAIETPLFLLADRYPRKWFISGGLCGMAAGAFAAALAPTALVLTAALSLAAVASGVASLAQSTLVDAFPDQRERVMTRWVMLGWAGDLAAPALIAGLAALSVGWRGAYAVVGALLAAWALAVARSRLPPRADPDEPTPGMWASLRAALACRRLMFWLVACWLCSLLDEILVVFASLYLRDELGAGVAERSAVLAAFMIGGAAGLAATDRLLHRTTPRRLLLIAASSCSLLYLLWMAAPSVWSSALAMAAVGATSAPLYPLAAAQAYAALPGRSGAVQAAGNLLVPLDLALPLLLGWLADRHGAGAALIVLVAQPVGLALVASIRRAW